MDHATGTMFLFNMSALCNMKSPLCNTRGVLCNTDVLRSIGALCGMGTL